MAIAWGEYIPAPDEPKVWFQSLETLAQVLSAKNRALLALIAETNPASLNELAEQTGRAKSNLSRTLKTMESYGLIHFEKGHGREIAPRVNYSGVELKMSFQWSENRANVASQRPASFSGLRRRRSAATSLTSDTESRL